MATPYTSGTAAKERDFFEKVIPGLKVVKEKNLELIIQPCQGEIASFYRLPGRKGDWDS